MPQLTSEDPTSRHQGLAETSNKAFAILYFPAKHTEEKKKTQKLALGLSEDSPATGQGGV